MAAACVRGAASVYVNGGIEGGGSGCGAAILCCEFVPHGGIKSQRMPPRDDFASDTDVNSSPPPPSGPGWSPFDQFIEPSIAAACGSIPR